MRVDLERVELSYASVILSICVSVRFIRICSGCLVLRFREESDFDLEDGELRNEEDLMKCTTGDSGPELRLRSVVFRDTDDIGTEGDVQGSDLVFAFISFQIREN